jgi:hypothetical protein
MKNSYQQKAKPIFMIIPMNLSISRSLSSEETWMSLTASLSSGRYYYTTKSAFSFGMIR